MYSRSKKYVPRPGSPTVGRSVPWLNPHRGLEGAPPPETWCSPRSSPATCHLPRLAYWSGDKRACGEGFWRAIFGSTCWPRFVVRLPVSVTARLKGVCLLHLLSENIFPVLRSNWFYVLMKQKLIWNLSLCYFSLFCFYLSGYDARTAERKSDSTWRTWYKQTARVYHSRRPISWLFPEMQYPVIYIIKFSNN